MPELTIEEVTLALAVVSGIAFLAILAVLLLALRIRKLRRQYTIVRGDAGDRDIVSVLSGWGRRVDDLNRRVDDVLEGQKRLGEIDRRALQRFHMVRYDAFEDMGGRLSFSAALLDENGDGLVITSINGRSETRTYAKGIRNLSSDHNLSEEEGEAIAGAVAGEGRSSRQSIAR
jgi:hypothetical protein